MKTRTADLKVPTAAQLSKRVDELVAEREQRRLDGLRAECESQALAELTAEVNRGTLDDLIARRFRAAGMTFVRDVWPDHPAADHAIGVKIGNLEGLRPAGVRRPFRLADDGVWFADYWLCSPMFPAGRTASGAIVVAFRVDGGWRYGTPTAPTLGHFGYALGGFDTLRSTGLKVNAEILRGSPELAAVTPDGKAFGDVEAAAAGDQAQADVKVRHPDDLMWRFVNATQNECPWEVPA